MMKPKSHTFMSQNSTSHASKRLLSIFVICLIVLSNSLTANADNFNKYVGQSFVLPVPKAPISNAAIRSWSYSSRSSHINVTNSGTMSLGEAVITSYFTGSETIECWYQYTIYNPNGSYTVGSSTEYHMVTCIGNNISIDGPKTQLNVGESMQLTYSFDKSTYGITPQITWKCGSNIASVDYRGYVTALRSGEATITAQSNLGGNVASYRISVREIDPTSVTISPSNASVYCDGTVTLSASVYPSGAPQNVTWSIYEGSSSTASVNSYGVVSGYNPGSITVKATAKNGVYGTRVVNVYEPSLTQTGSTPSNNAVEQNVFITPTVTFSHALSKSIYFDQISMKTSDGTSIPGAASISGKSVVFNPSKPLAPNTKYVLTIPSNAVKNKWGTSYSKVVNLIFTTGELEKLTISISPNIRFVKNGATFKLTSSKVGATIYYTKDGTQPTNKSLKYCEPIAIQNDVKIRAVAHLEGYADSEILSQDYIISNVAVTNCFPNNENPLYKYADVIPSMTFSNRIEASSNIDKISFTCVGLGELQKNVIVCDSAIYIIPNVQLELGNIYTISIPANAIKTWQGEYNEAAQWSFTTGDYFKQISARGPELSMALKSDNSLFIWGSNYESGSNTDGSYNYHLIESPIVFMSDVVNVSSGYMHHAAIKADGSLWMWGRQYCGEFGNGSGQASSNPVKVLNGDVSFISAGGQATGLIKSDGSLWMAGRNDFGQIGNNSTNIVKTFVQVMNNVKSVSVGWCNTLAVTNDNKLYGWGRNDMAQLPGLESNMILEPTLLMENVKMASLSSTASKYFAAIKTNGDLIVWETGNEKPQTIDGNVSFVSVGKDYLEYIKEDGTLWGMGLNSYGQLGNGNSEELNQPVTILEGVKSICTSQETTFALKENGSVWSWGHNKNGMLGQTGIRSEICMNPTQVLDGIPMSDLMGISSYKKNLSIPVNTDGVVPVYPYPLTANYSAINWSSSNPEYVTIDDRGIIHGESVGKSTIKATIQDNKGKQYDATCIISVVDSGNGIDDIYSSDLIIWVSELKVHLQNVPANTTVTLVGINGEILDTKKSIGAEIILNAPNTGVYVVIVGNQSYKVLCK